MTKLLRAILVAVIPGVILVGITLAVDRKVMSDENRIRELEYKLTPVNGIINKPDLGSRELDILLDGNPIENISTLQVSLYNRTNRDYEDVLVYVELHYPTHDQVEVITDSYRSPIGLPRESVQRLPETSDPSTPGARRFGYAFTTINRSPDQYTPVFELSFLVLGTNAPEASVEVQKAGLMAKQYSYPEASLVSVVVASSLIAALYIGLFVYLWRYDVKQRKRKQEFQPKLQQAFAERFPDESVAVAAFEVYKNVHESTKTEAPIKRAWKWLAKTIRGDTEKGEKGQT